MTIISLVHLGSIRARLQYMAHSDRINVLDVIQNLFDSIKDICMPYNPALDGLEL